MSTIKIDRKNLIISVLAVVCLLLTALLILRDAPPTADKEAGHQEITAEESIWTCSMHPQIRQPKPGLCPICGMALIPADQGDQNEGSWELTLSDHARTLADIQTTAVERKQVVREIRMVGKITYDEKRVSDITAWVPGRIDRLFVDFTGIEVVKGDHMVELYSPDLITAQQELRQALRSATSGPESIKQASVNRLAAVRKKMSLLGLSEAQIQIIENRESQLDRLTIESPITGVVIQKHLNEGRYVQTGTPIYTVADLSRVWVVLEAYESDIAWFRYGQEARFEVEAYPGETYTGRIVFIDPVLNPRTRTVKVRIDMPNPDGKLKPDMFVRAVAQAKISSGGKVIDPSLAGKWVSRMHPEVVKDGPGSCDVCGMPLVKAEELGFVAADTVEAPLVIPMSAALVTGERAVVYVASDEVRGSFEGREIVLGPEAGSYYVVKSGLEEGERVVTNGTFKIDSELQIRAKKSMMYHPSAETETPTPIFDTNPAFRKMLGPVYNAYFGIQTYLSRDALSSGREAGAALKTALEAVTADQLEARALAQWRQEINELGPRLDTFVKAADLEQARAPFKEISQVIYRIAQMFGFPEQTAIFRFHCPMAFNDKGADWLQNHAETANPYFGAAMFSCGSQVENVIESRAKSVKPEHKKGDGHVH